MLVKEFFENTINMLFPDDITCFLCGKEINKGNLFLCDKCEKTLLSDKNRCARCDSVISDENKFCASCTKYSRDFDLARAKFLYEGKVSERIKEFKYDGKKSHAKYFARVMAISYLELKNLGQDFDFIIPVPLHEEKLKQRGFNQAELLAQEFYKIINIPVKSDLVIRTINTKTQTSLSKEERLNNMKNAFKVVDKKFCKNKNFLIIDDILTTGATTESIAKVLKKSGAKSVCVIAAARAIFKD